MLGLSPPPTVVFCSPLTRAIQTAIAMFGGTGVSRFLFLCYCCLLLLLFFFVFELVMVLSVGASGVISGCICCWQ